MPKKLIRNGWRSTTDSYGYDLVTLNHYAVRSAESFLVKRDRGRVNHVDRDQGLSYWFRMNNNWEQNASAQTKLPIVQAEFERLMSDPELRAAHDYSVIKHREKIEELKIKDLPILKIDHLNVGPYVRNTMLIDKCDTREEALIDIYRVMRPGEPPTVDSA